MCRSAIIATSTAPPSSWRRLSKDQAIDAILSSPDRVEVYERAPWLREFDMLMWQDMNPQGIARAIREVVRDVAVEDRELLRRVTAPTMIIGREGDRCTRPSSPGCWPSSCRTPS